MIPVKLELFNFLAYRTPEPLDMTGLHLACLAGANGAGKSSLLDAITWSLWGKARTRRDDDLIHGDEIEMQVRLTFRLMENLYRVTRYRNRKGRGSSELSLEVQDGDGWRILSGATIRETQQHIVDLLKLDYDTFINSAFLVQGHADEFTQKTPGDRKVILGEILGLDRWQTYEDRAKERIKAHEQEILQIDAELNRIAEELGREGEYRQELAHAQQEMEDLGQQVGKAERYVRELDGLRQQRQTVHDRYMDLEQHIGRDRKDLEHFAGQQLRYQERMAGYQGVIARQDEIEAGYQTLLDARQLADELADRLIEQGELREHLNRQQQVIVAARSELEAEQRSLHNRQQILAQSLAALGTEQAQLAERQAEIAHLEEREAERQTWDDERAHLREQRAELLAVNQNLKAEMEAIKAQQDEIAATSDPVCPLCEQELSPEHRADLLDRLARDGKEKGDAFRANREQIHGLDETVEELTRSINEAETALRALRPLQDHVAQLEERLKQAEDQQQERATAEARLTEIAEHLSTGAYAKEAHAKQAELHAQLAELGYDEQAHQEAREAIRVHETYDAQHSELEHVLKALPELEEEVARLEAQAAEREGRVAEAVGKLAELTADIAALDEKIVELAPWEAQLNDLHDKEKQASYRVGAAEQKINTLENQRQRQTDLTERRQQVGERQGIYEVLREAFSKNGVPAMIIEAAIPEIENEANEILARMTDGRMHLRFETQRENVTGGVRETLDIQIADELGTRDYETFSGGEAFRVDFAIRLALSRLLARRAGTQLRTLILDEGFGTQDTRGRERLVQAINSIKDDFDLILVITHIDELKDAFPARIEITKTSQGSVIEVV